MAFRDFDAAAEFAALAVPDRDWYSGRNGFGLDLDSPGADPHKLERDNATRRVRRALAFAEALALRSSHCLNGCANLLPICKAGPTLTTEYCTTRCREEARWPRRNLAKWVAALKRRPSHCQRPECCNLLPIVMGNGVAQARYCSLYCGHVVRAERKRARKQLSGR